MKSSGGVSRIASGAEELPQMMNGYSVQRVPPSVQKPSHSQLARIVSSSRQTTIKIAPRACSGAGKGNVDYV